MRAVLLLALLASAAAVPIVPGESSGVISAHLRGVSAGAPKTLNAKTDDRAPRGHFYYAAKCEDCFYKGAGCGCKPAVEYFACLTKHCHSSDSAFFGEKCSALGNNCSADLDIKCSGADTVCKSRFSQLPTGGLGFSLDVVEDDAYCGPNGKCIGKLGLNVHLHNEPKEEKKPELPTLVPGSPAPAMAVAAPVAKPAKKLPEMWLECGLPKMEHADIDHKMDWNLCQKQVKGSFEECSVEMFKQLEAGGSKKAYCVITEGKNGKRLTAPSWSKVINAHKAPAAPVAEKPTASKADAPKPAAAPKKAEEPEQDDPLVIGDSKEEKLPWMVEKEKRAAAKKAEDAQKVEKKEEVPKKEKEAPPPAAKGGDSALPWMQGKASDKPPPPHAAIDPVIGAK
jgi:hypothetical protein